MEATNKSLSDNTLPNKEEKNSDSALGGDSFGRN
jgi:hypothetical protein